MTHAQPVNIYCPEQDSPGVNFALGDLTSDLQNAGFGFSVNRKLSRQDNTVDVYLALSGDNRLPEWLQQAEVPDKEESYSILRGEEDKLAVLGRDATGLMYGILDLAEQIRWIENPVSLAQVE